MAEAFFVILQRDLHIALRRKGDVLNVLVFFIVVASLFPLGVGPEPNQLRAMAAGVVWIAALLAAVLSLPRLFAADHADGTLEQLLVSPQPLLCQQCVNQTGAFGFVEDGNVVRFGVGLDRDLLFDCWMPPTHNDYVAVIPKS